MSETKTAQEGCAKLLCKGMITRAPDVRGNVSAYDATVWWCCETQKVVGPDDRPVGPRACCAGRACWVARENPA
jgi:hypothetical protein